VLQIIVLDLGSVLLMTQIIDKILSGSEETTEMHQKRSLVCLLRYCWKSI